MPVDAADAGMVAAIMWRAAIRAARSRRCGAAGPDCLELRLLFFAWLAIEILERGAHAFDGLQHDIQSFASRFKPRGRRNGFARLAGSFEHISRSSRGVLER